MVRQISAMPSEELLRWRKWKASKEQKENTARPSGEDNSEAEEVVALFGIEVLTEHGMNRLGTEIILS